MLEVLFIYLFIYLFAVYVMLLSNRYEYQEYYWGKGRPARKADNLSAICEPIVQKMWEPQHLITL
jgi:hypothetical protein